MPKIGLDYFVSSLLASIGEEAPLRVKVACVFFEGMFNLARKGELRVRW